MNGRLIVLEGTDGSGKSTQFSRLCARLTQEQAAFHRLVFPRYDNPSSALLSMYLHGQFGTHPEDVNAFAASAFFSVDRYASWNQDWGDYYRGGGLVLSDRYTTSNAVHQAGKVAPEERPEFCRWRADFEYDRRGLPRPDLVLWLDMPTAQAVANLRRREAETHTQGDIHEVDEGYLHHCHDVAQEACSFYGWTRISCVDDAGALRSIDQLHEQIWSHVAPFLKKKEEN